MKQKIIHLGHKVLRKKEKHNISTDLRSRFREAEPMMRNLKNWDLLHKNHSGALNDHFIIICELYIFHHFTCKLLGKHTLSEKTHPSQTKYSLWIVSLWRFGKRKGKRAIPTDWEWNLNTLELFSYRWHSFSFVFYIMCLCMCICMCLYICVLK